jgi:TonB family protein
VLPPAVAAPAPQPVPLVEVPAQLSHSLVERVASDHSRELAKCESGEQLHGDITVQFMIDASGKVTKAQLATGLKKPKVTACILRAVQKWQFGKQGPTGALGTYTLSFQ